MVGAGHRVPKSTAQPEFSFLCIVIGMNFRAVLFSPSPSSKGPFSLIVHADKYLNRWRKSEWLFLFFWFDTNFGFVVNGRMRRNRFGQPDITANHRIVSDYRIATENRTAGIDDHVVFNGRVAFLSAQLFVHVGRPQRKMPVPWSM